MFLLVFPALDKLLYYCHVLERNPSSAFVFRGEEYKLFWPEKGEFVRLAAAAGSGAVIIPFSAVGIADR